MADGKGRHFGTTTLAGIIGLTGGVSRSGDLPVEVEEEDATVVQSPLAGVEATPAGPLVSLATMHTACLAPKG